MSRQKLKIRIGYNAGSIVKLNKIHPQSGTAEVEASRPDGTKVKLHIPILNLTTLD